MLDDGCEAGHQSGGDLAPVQRHTSSYVHDEVGNRNRRRAIAGLALTLSAVILCLKASLPSPESRGGNPNALLELSAENSGVQSKQCIVSVIIVFVDRLHHDLKLECFECEACVVEFLAKPRALWALAATILCETRWFHALGIALEMS